MASGIYSNFTTDVMKAVFNLSTDTVKTALLTSSHSFTAANSVFSDVSANEITGTGYTAGGVTLGSKTVGTVAAGVFDAADAQWAGADFTAAHAVVYDTTATSKLLCSFDFGGNQTVSGPGTFTIQWNAGGIIDIS